MGREYYCGLFVAMVLIAFFNGVVFFPVLLTLLGPGAPRGGDGGGKGTAPFSKLSIGEELSLPLSMLSEDGSEPVPPPRSKHAQADTRGAEDPTSFSQPPRVRHLSTNAVVLEV
jgi:hypothetical protein